MTSRQHAHDGLTVPYVQLWSHERGITPRLERRNGREGPFLAFADEGPHDRDSWGALWARYTLAHGKGTADFTSLHPLRQRRAVTRGLCQVCAAEPPPNELEAPPLFLLQSAGGRPIRDGELTHAAPVCEPCAEKALRDCPPLRRGAVAARVRYPMAWGVAGILYDLNTLRPLSKDRVDVSYTTPLIKSVLAYRAVVSLHECTPVDVASLLANSEPPCP